ncbi:MAG: ATP-binding cassette domain-containing protein, partial [Lachnospiraceae bacterium]|nr:ATP-binding cassette domain-containing protein [Lachnospiraceae bacterium]
MIEIRNVTKSYDKIKAVDDVSVSIKENTVFGLIGTNGAGKSTVLRMVAGVLEPEKGEIAIDGLPVFDNMEAKKKIYFIADEPYFFANSNATDMQMYLCSVYPEFAVEDFYNYLVNFGLDKKRKINTYSKGMKKQLALICGVCSGTKYLL